MCQAIVSAAVTASGRKVSPLATARRLLRLMKPAVAPVGGNQTVSGIVGIVGVAVDLVVAYGLLALKRWAWVLALVGVGITVVTGIMGLFSGGLIAACCGVLGLVIPAAILFYLMRPDVRRTFGR